MLTSILGRGTEISLCQEYVILLVDAQQPVGESFTAVNQSIKVVSV